MREGLSGAVLRVFGEKSTRDTPKGMSFALMTIQQANRHAIEGKIFIGTLLLI